MCQNLSKPLRSKMQSLIPGSQNTALVWQVGSCTNPDHACLMTSANPQRDLTKCMLYFLFFSGEPLIFRLRTTSELCSQPCFFFYVSGTFSGNEFI